MATTSSISIEDNTLLPFQLDASYKGDEVTEKVAKIIGMSNIDGWQIVDTFENLAMVHYKEDGDMTKVGHLRGLVVDIEVGAIVAESFGYTPTAVLSSLKSEEDKFIIKDTDGVVHTFSQDNVIMKQAFEGVVIRIIWHKGKMLRMTHKKITPTKSRWGNSKTFLTMYDEANGPKAEDLFDTSKQFSDSCYDFLVCDPSLFVGTRQKVNKPYIVFLTKRKMTVKRPESDVATGTDKFIVTTTFSFEETSVHDPKSLSLEEANHHLNYGFYNKFEVADNRNSTGEAIIMLSIENDCVKDIVKIHSPAYQHRVTMRGNNPNIINQFYCLLDSVYPEISDEDEWKKFTSRYIIYPKFEEEEIKNYYKNNIGILYLPTAKANRYDYSDRDSRIRLLWINYVLSLPTSLQSEALNILSDFYRDRNAVIYWVQSIEQTNKDINTFNFITENTRNSDLKVRNRIIQLVDSSRKFSRKRVSEGNNYSQGGTHMNLPTLIKNSIRNFITKEKGESLYALIRVMKREKQ